MKKQEKPNKKSPAVTITCVSERRWTFLGVRSGLTTPEPIQIINILAWNKDVHAPHACHYVHWQDDGAQDCQLAKHVGCLLLALIHTDVDLCQVV